LHTFNIKTLCWCYMWDIFRSKNFKQCCLKNFCFSCFKENINIYTLPALSRPNSNIRSSSCGVERSLRNISSKPWKGIVGLVISLYGFLTIMSLNSLNWRFGCIDL
jgi:hypothetical protein